MLKNDKGETWFDVENKPLNYQFTEQIKIPDDLSCDRCTLSWRW